MAFGGRNSYPTNSGSNSLTNVDGVEIRLGDGLKPPKKVTLPIDYQLGNPTDVLFMEYNFSVEESVVQWTEAQRRIQEALNQAETQSSEATEENVAIGNGPEAVVPDPPDIGEDTQGQETAGQNSQRVTTLTTPSFSGIRTELFPAQPQPRQNPAPFYQWTNSGILVPTPIANTITKDTSGNTGESKIPNSKANFNIADFEGEEDPFENCELKVLNTMEELDKVLQASSLSRKQNGPSSGLDLDGPNVNGTQTGHQSTGGVPNGTRLPQPYTAQTDTGSVSQPSAMSLKDVEYPDLDDIGNSNSNSMTAGRPFVSRGAEHVQFVNGGAHFSKTSLPSASSSAKCLPSKVISSGNPTPYTSLPFAQLSQTTGNSSVKSFQEYMEQLNSFSHGQSPNGLVHNVAKADEFYQKRAWSTPPPNNRLRSARSTPDLAGLEEMISSRPSYPHSHSPPPFINRTQTPPPRPSSGQDWNPYHPLPPAPTGHESGNRLSSTISAATPHSQDSQEARSSGTSPGQTTNKTSPDPYKNLSPAKQRFVNNITDMGFPRAQVARAVDKLGEDDKKVVDHLCSVNRMSEKGFDAEDAENALYLFEQKEVKAAQYLRLVKQFRELGFREAKIRDALVSCDLDENKALDSLFGT